VSCPNCGAEGNEGQHWLSQPDLFEGYICFPNEQELRRQINVEFARHLHPSTREPDNEGDGEALGPGTDL
jgi:hypothetical protein